MLFKLHPMSLHKFRCVDVSGYEGRKLRENIECEIFQTILEEARDSYRAEIVHELTSNTPDDMESNISQILKWIELYSSNNSSSLPV